MPGLCDAGFQIGDLPLHFASLRGHLAVTQLLAALEPSTLFVKGSVRCATPMVLSHVRWGDRTPLEKALENHHPETAAFLEAAMVSGCVRHGCTPLTSASVWW